MNKRISILLLVAGILLVGLVSAQMTVISNIKGHVYDEWSIPLLNVTVTAWVGGTLRGSSTTQDDYGDAYFNIDVNGTMSELGQTITFQVDGVLGVENASFTLWIGDQNFTLHQAPVNRSILINEFKTGAGGWIELYNNDSYSTNLRNWSLGGGDSQAGAGSETDYAIVNNTMIQPRGFALLSVSLTKMVLNGSVGNITLTDPVEMLHDTIAYISSSFNTSWSEFPHSGSVGRSADGSPAWTFFSNPTPGYSNVQEQVILLSYGWNLVSLPLEG